MRHTVLVLARDVATRALLARALQNAGHAVELAESPAQVRGIGAGKAFSLAIVAPEGLGSAGLDLLHELRTTIGRVLVVAAAGADGNASGDAIDPADSQALLARVAEALRPYTETELPPLRLRFAGYTLDVPAHRLTDPEGAIITLTPREFALLTEFVHRPGRVLSRDFLLDAVAGRRADPFDRSIDIQVGRLRRKIEPDAKQPTLIVTVPGAGYRFDAQVTRQTVPDRERTEACTPAPAIAANGIVDEPAVPDVTDGPPQRVSGLPSRRSPLLWLSAAALLVLVVAAAALLPRASNRAQGDGPAIAVLPFSDLGGSRGNDYFAKGVAEDLRTILSTFPGIRVVAGESNQPTGAVQPSQSLAPDYTLEGGVLKGADRVRVTAQLVNARTGQNVWADRYDAEGMDVIALQESIANRIYDSIAGLEGRVRKDEERNAWQQAAPSLSEYDFYLRGHAFLFRGTCEDTIHARQIWQDGLSRFPQSALLKIKIGFSYSNNVENYCSADPRGDIERAWVLGREGMATADKSPLATWLGHWLMTVLYQWHDGDFERSAAEAEATARLVPYDARSRASLAFYLANGGKLERAAEWASWAARRTGENLGYLNLAWAYYLMGRYPEALASIQHCDATLPGYAQQLAAIYVRLGRIGEARAVMRAWMTRNPHDSVAFETSWPLKPEFKQAYIADLRAAGMPERGS